MASSVVALMLWPATLALSLGGRAPIRAAVVAPATPRAVALRMETDDGTPLTDARKKRFASHLPLSPDLLPPEHGLVRARGCGRAPSRPTPRTASPGSNLT